MNPLLTQTIPEVGLVRGLSNASYHGHPSLSKSQLADFLVCPANYYGLHLDPNRPPRDGETAGQRAGTLLHTLVLEPETFNERYAIGPDVNRNTKLWKEFAVARSARLTLLKPDEYAEGLMQAKSLRRHKEVAELLESGQAETSVFWTDHDTGLPLRCRPDWLHETPEGWIVLDLKTGPAAPWAFSSQCSRMTYQVQDAFYSDGIAQATGKPVIAFVFGVIETSQPFISMCGVLDDDSRTAARKTYREALARFAECKAKDEWPGFEGVQLLRLPAYALATNQE